MATGLHAVLKGVQPDLRDTIRGLCGEGWSASRTNGGHIRLNHPQAEKPVFTSSTPSDFRTPQNLLRDCRSALLGSTRCAGAVAPALSGEEAEEVLRAHKARVRRQGRPHRPPLPVTPQKPVRRERPALSVPGPDLPISLEPPPAPTQTLLEPEEEPMNMMTSLEAEAPVRPAPTRTRAPRAREVPATQTPGGLDQGSVEFGIRLGLRIARGELTAIRITPEMVGKSLLLEPGAGLQLYALDEPETSADAKKPAFRKNARISDAILAFLGELRGEEVPIGMIADHLVETGHYKPRSARPGVRARLELLEAEGRVRLRTGAGEPVATLAE